MKKFLIYITLFFSASYLHAQTFYPQTGSIFYNSNTFSVNNYAPFTMPYSLPNQQEGYAQLNDSACTTGGLNPVIFSTNGLNVYNGGTGILEPTAAGLLGEPNSTNAATIVPILGGKALIITTKAWSNATNEAYSSIISYVAGSCGVYTLNMPAATKNLQIIGTGGVTSFTEKVSVMRKPTGNDYWLLMHEATNAGIGSNKFLVFSISYATGSITAVAAHNAGLPIKKVGGKGQMQAVLGQDPTIGSAYLIGAAYFMKPLSMGGATDILIMNPTTGVVTLKETILYGAFRPYGLEFSRSGNYCYVAFRNVLKTIFRYDPYAAPGSIFTTAVPSGYGASVPPFRFGQLQRLDNDMIYTPLFGSNTLLYITASSLPTSFPLAPPSLTVNAPAGTVFRFGLPNYWRN
jgi:hypothetical protein